MAARKQPKRKPKKDPKRPKCGEAGHLTAQGKPCRRLVVPGTDACEAHGRKPKRGGRPSLLSKEIIEDLAKHLKGGNFITTSCKAVGLRSTDTFYDWMKKGLELVDEREAAFDRGELPPVLDEHEQLLYLFADTIEKAEALGEIALISNIRAGIPGWQGSAWIAQRRWRERYGDTRQIDGENDPITEILADFRQQRAARQGDLQ